MPSGGVAGLDHRASGLSAVSVAAVAAAGTAKSVDGAFHNHDRKLQPQQQQQQQAQHAQPHGVSAIKEIGFGSVAGMVAKVFEYPFDTIKVRLQAQPNVYSGPLNCFRAGLGQDGFLGFYRGMSAPLFGAAVENSSLFVSVR